jgi:hypothetical protein
MHLRSETYASDPEYPHSTLSSYGEERKIEDAWIIIELLRSRVLLEVRCLEESGVVPSSSSSSENLRKGSLASVTSTPSTPGHAKSGSTATTHDLRALTASQASVEEGDLRGGVVMVVLEVLVGLGQVHSLFEEFGDANARAGAGRNWNVREKGKEVLRWVGGLITAWYRAPPGEGWKEDWERVVRNMVGSLSHFLFFAMCGADKLISFFFPIR